MVVRHVIATKQNLRGAGNHPLTTYIRACERIVPLLDKTKLIENVVAFAGTVRSREHRFRNRTASVFQHRDETMSIVFLRNAASRVGSNTLRAPASFHHAEILALADILTIQMVFLLQCFPPREELALPPPIRIPIHPKTFDACVRLKMHRGRRDPDRDRSVTRDNRSAALCRMREAMFVRSRDEFPEPASTVGRPSHGFCAQPLDRAG